MSYVQCADRPRARSARSARASRRRMCASSSRSGFRIRADRARSSAAARGRDRRGRARRDALAKPGSRSATIAAPGLDCPVARGALVGLLRKAVSRRRTPSQSAASDIIGQEKNPIIRSWSYLQPEAEHAECTRLVAPSVKTAPAAAQPRRIALLARAAAAGDAGAAVPARLDAARACVGASARGMRDGRVDATAAVPRARPARAALAQGDGFLAPAPGARAADAISPSAVTNICWSTSTRARSPGSRAARGRDGRPLLSPAEVAAGEKLRADFTRGQMAPRVTANWEAAVSSGRRGRRRIAGRDGRRCARRAHAGRRGAVEAVGPELSGALLDVCCFLKGLEEVERDRGWPARGAKLVLGLGARPPRPTLRTGSRTDRRGRARSSAGVRPTVGHRSTARNRHDAR